MIYSLKGIIETKNPTFLVLDVNNVGYGVHVSAQTSDNIPNEGEKLKLLIYHHITENGQQLFGFLSNDEKNLFEKLITVKGIGPKMGISILSGMPSSEIIACINQNNATQLAKTPGIGKKTAERIILELKDKIDLSNQSSIEIDSFSNLEQDAIAALVSLGYKANDAQKAVSLVKKSKTLFKNASELVKITLKSLNT